MGSYQIRASIEGSSSVTFSATATSSPVEIVSGNGQVGLAGTTLAQPLVVLHLALEELLRPLVELLALDDLDRDRMPRTLGGRKAHLGEGALAQHLLLEAVVRQLFHQQLVSLRSLRGSAAYGVALSRVGGGLFRWICSLAVLLQQVLFEVDDVPVFVAGGIATGRMCAHLFLMGAAGVQLGTVFAVAQESCAHQNFKEKFIKSNARDAASTPQYDSRLPVVAVRALRNKGMDEFGQLQLDLLSQMDEGSINRTDAQIEVEKFWMGALRRAV